MRALFFLLFVSVFLLNQIDGKKHHWISSSTTTSTTPEPNLADKHLNLRNESSEELSPIKDDSLASELADAVGQAGSEEPLVVSGVVSNSGVSKQSLKLAAPEMTDSSEQIEDLEVADKKPMPKSSPSPASLSRVHLYSPTRSRGSSSEITLDSSEEDIQSNKTISKTAGEREKLLDSIQVVTTSKPPKPKGGNIEVKDELVDPIKICTATLTANKMTMKVWKREGNLLRREAPKPDATVKDVKEAPGGVAFTVNTEPDSPRKAKPVLSSSSRSSSTSPRSYSPRIEAGMEVRKRRNLESAQLPPSLGARSSNRSILADLLGIGLKAPMLAIDPKEDDNGHVPKKFIKTELNSPPRPKVQLPGQSSSSSSESEEKSHQNDSSNEDNSLEQILIIAESGEKEPKSQHFIKNMHKNSMRTGPVFIQNSELHFESGGMAKPHKPHPFGPRPFGMEGRPDVFHRGGPPPMPFGAPPPPFPPHRGPPFGGPPNHPAGFGREMDKDGHFGREMPLPPPFRKEIERSEEGLWMSGRGLTLTLHLNATSLGILSMLVVIVILFKLYKMVHKKQAKQFFAHFNQKKEENSNKQAPSISILDEIKI
uniref:Uncharacterized protein n=1 Tax=Ditylenchus dipsaci TaxID=166011 RepID=A0A915DJU3_9BILA